MYCTVDDIRAEGVSEEQASDEKLTELIALASGYIDKMTGQFFEPREDTVRLNGHGGKILKLPVFLIEDYDIKISGETVEDYTLYNRFPPADDRPYPKIYRYNGWKRGILNIEVHGLWGYVDKVNTGYVTPPLIKRAVMKLAMYNFPDLGDKEAQDEKALKGLIQSETTDGHSYDLSEDVLKAMYENSLTGDVEIDGIIEVYRMPNIGIALV